MPSDRTGLLIIRAWIEEGSSEPLRARIRCTTDISEAFTGVVHSEMVSRPEDVFASVREWLNQMMRFAETSD